MYTKNNRLYSDAGKILVTDNMIGYAFPSSTANVGEEDITIDDMTIEDNEFIVYNNGRIKQRYYPNYSYADWKMAIIKQRYNNDDQIAIMLNEDNEEYQRMQDWRDWASVLARKITETQNKQN